MNILIICSPYIYVAKRLQEEASKQGISLEFKDIHQVAVENFQIDPANYDAIYIRQVFTDLTRQMLPHELQGLVELAVRFKQAGKVVVDENIAQGDIGQGKYEALKRLAAASIHIPKTTLLSETNLTQITFPVIAKWNFGAKAKQVYLVKNLQHLEKVLKLHPKEEILIQEFVPAEYEYKIFTAGFKSLPLVLRVPTNLNKFLADLKCAEILPQEQAQEAVSMAEKASRILGRELAKTDILEANGQLYILEVNRRPGFQYFEQKTKLNVAGSFLEYVKNKA